MHVSLPGPARHASAGFGHSCRVLGADWPSTLAGLGYPYVEDACSAGIFFTYLFVQRVVCFAPALGRSHGRMHCLAHLCLACCAWLYNTGHGSSDCPMTPLSSCSYSGPKFWSRGRSHPHQHDSRNTQETISSHYRQSALQVVNRFSSSRIKYRPMWVPCVKLECGLFQRTVMRCQSAAAVQGSAAAI